MNVVLHHDRLGADGQVRQLLDEQRTLTLRLGEAVPIVTRASAVSEGACAFDRWLFQLGVDTMPDSRRQLPDRLQKLMPFPLRAIESHPGTPTGVR